MTTVFFVVPCYNEEEVLSETAKRLLAKITDLIESKKISTESRILFVDDGSHDKTWEIISRLHDSSEYFCGLKLSHNRGHQYALQAGLITVKEFCDCAISLDADLQDDIEVIDQFIENFHNGSDIVYGVRSKRETDTKFKKHTALMFYKLMKFLGVDIVYNHADYRLMSKRALEAFSEYKEHNIFIRGIIPLIGFKSSTVFYERHERFAGKSKYPFKKMLSFAFEGITSFSVKPLRLISSVGVIISILSIFALLYILISKIFGSVVAGWAATTSSIWLLGGIQLLCLGVLGEYVGKIYSEVKARPNYIIEKFLKK